MSTFRRWLVVFASVGWIAPLTLAFWAEHHFLTKVIWPWVAWHDGYGGSWHPVAYVPQLFYGSMIWLAAVIAWWVWRLTGADRPR